MNDNPSLVDISLGRVKQSRQFYRSATSQALLEYLVRASEKGETPKELQIAVEVLGKKVDSDKELNVRPYISKTRKKLEEYYQTEGRYDEMRFELPKGNYRIAFHKKEESKKPGRLLAGALALLGISLVAHLFFILSGPSDDGKIKNLPIWSGFTNSDKQTAIILGDHYFVHAKLENGMSGTVRLIGVNDDNNLAELNKELAENGEFLAKSKVSYVNRQGPRGLFNVMGILGGGNTDTQMLYSSKVKWEDIKDKNAIFIGSIKTLALFGSLTKQLGFSYEHRTLSVIDGQDTVSFKNSSGSYPHSEYAATFHFTTEDGRRVLFFFCDNDIGNIGALKYFTDPEGIKAFAKEHLNGDTENFISVFEVKGQDQQDFSVKPCLVRELKQPVEELWP
ncbi:hypothetical protein FUAX_32300 [Fulvitalea axinellae]|uniref:Uncharacterized protein n=1 Tax=Fulvitalea axinellae TaxID=1182444 RepID=A0AAU9CKT1_9BACT|nr:hypothetical protein FUAX_32300 [Fulvitalea axinellae]